jgi:mannosylglycerate hydrolase
LEIRPEREKQIRDLVKAGRLQIGPWYTLPDSSSINGESLIRNLMTGFKKCRDFGSVMNLGYNVFSFGQISQLPQLYAGFGIDTIVFYKHMDRKRSRFDEFIWKGPDGTEALATRLGREARWNFFFAGHIPIVYNRDPWHKDWQYNWGEMGKSFHFCEQDTYAGFHFITEPETGFHPEKIREGFERTLATLKDTVVPEHLLFFDGTDFTEPHPQLPEIIKEAQKIFGNEYEIVHSTLEEYIKAIKPIIQKRDIDTVTGHMKDGPAGSVHTDVLSVHLELKKANNDAENKLFRLAEPFATIAWLQNGTYPKSYIDKALNLMFKSQAHDSLHGVGPRALSAGVEERLLQAKIISENVAAQSLQIIASNINTSSIKDGGLFLTVFNPCAFKRSQIIEAYLDIPRSWPVEELIVQDSSGLQLDIYELERIETKAGLYHPRSRNMPMYINRFRMLIDVRDVPALGYKTLTVTCSERAMYPYPHEDFDRVKIPFVPIALDARRAENEFVKLYIADDGTLEITDKKSGDHYKNLNYFLDEGQNGNQQRCFPPKIDRIITTLGKPADIALLINTDLLARFEISTKMLLPRYFDKARNRRSDDHVELPIKSFVTIRKGCEVIEVETTFDNTVKDHFLRVCFATGIKTDHTVSSEVFNTEIHPVMPMQDGKWQGTELRRHQQHLFMDISDGKRGITILNDSLSDYEVISPDSGLIAMSLIRSVELHIPCDNRLWMDYPGDDSTQSLRKHSTRYGIMLHNGNCQDASVYSRALEFNVPMRLAQIAKQIGSLPCDKSFFEISSKQLVLSCVKKSEQNNSVIVRLYNPTDQVIESTLTAGFSFKQVHLARLDETRISGVPVSANMLIKISVDHKKIMTYEFEL